VEGLSGLWAPVSVALWQSDHSKYLGYSRLETIRRGRLVSSRRDTSHLWPLPLATTQRGRAVRDGGQAADRLIRLDGSFQWAGCLIGTAAALAAALVGGGKAGAPRGGAYVPNAERIGGGSMSVRPEADGDPRHPQTRPNRPVEGPRGREWMPQGGRRLRDCCLRQKLMSPS
jgi:hypothetical protein